MGTMKLDKLLKQTKEILGSDWATYKLCNISPDTYKRYIQGQDVRQKQAKFIISNIDVLLSNLSDALIDAQQEYTTQFNK